MHSTGQLLHHSIIYTSSHSLRQVNTPPLINKYKQLTQLYCSNFTETCCCKNTTIKLC